MERPQPAVLLVAPETTEDARQQRRPSENLGVGREDAVRGIALICLPISATTPGVRGSDGFRTPTVCISSWITTVEWLTCRRAITSSSSRGARPCIWSI